MTIENPLISIIVPIFNSDEYLEECLDSLASQCFDSFEVILVNDGSTDTSEAIVGERTQRDARFRSLEMENRGPGAARNFALKHAKGTYVAFCDSDDTVPKFAYKHLYALAQKHGCDVVIGSAGRFKGTKRLPSRLHQKAHAQLDELVHITTHPQLINDTTAWNKLYSRDFLERIDFHFPEGMIFEDIPPMIELHYRAKICAFLDEVVYRWRLRDRVTTSLTQDKTKPGNLEDRCKAMGMVDEFFASNVTESNLIQAKNHKWLSNDLMIYLNVLPEMEDHARRDTMRELILDFAGRIDNAAFDKLDAIDRIKYHFLELGDYESLARAIELSKEGTETPIATLHDDGRYYGSFGLEGIAGAITDMTHEISDHGMQTVVETVSFENHKLALSGCISLPRVVTSADDRYEVSVALHPTLRGAPEPTVQATCTTSTCSALSQSADEVAAERFECRFEATFPRDEFASLPNGTFLATISASYCGLELRPTTLKNPVDNRQAKPFAHTTDDGRMACALYNRRKELKITLNEIASPIIKSISNDGSALIVVDSTGKRHAISYQDIDLENHMIGDPLERPYYYLDASPLLCEFDDGFLHMTRISSGRPFVNYYEQAVMLIDAQLDKQTLSLIAQPTEALRKLDVSPTFSFRRTNDNTTLALPINAVEFDGLYLIEANLDEIDLKSSDPEGTFVLQFTDKDGESHPIFWNAARCAKLNKTTTRQGWKLKTQIVNAAGCKIIITRKSSPNPLKPLKALGTKLRH